MPNICNILFLGGDLRNQYMVDELINNYNVYSYGLFDDIKIFSLSEYISKNDIIVCPTPFSKDNENLTSITNTIIPINELLSNLTEKHTLFGGALPKYVCDFCNDHNIKYIDLLKCEEVAILNSISTAEGAIAEAIKESTLNLHHSNCLVLGYGRCGITLANKLSGLNAYVTVGARNVTQLSTACSNGHNTLDISNISSNESLIDYFSITDYLKTCNFIFNTIPSPIISSTLIDVLNKDCIIIDIASNPGGCDFEYCKSQDINAKLCLGLPGKYSPKTSGVILTKALLKHI